MMKILVTGAAGFAGKNLVENLKNIRDGKNMTRPTLSIEEVYEYDLDSAPDELEEYCAKADFVFNFAGVNRPKGKEEYKKNNYDFAALLLETLKRYGNKAPVMLASSVQATLAGRFGLSEYGLSKKAGEELFIQYGKENDVEALVYRFPNLVGKWVRPNYNSAVGTFCYNIANDLPVVIDDPSVELDLLFIEDLIEEMFDALEGHPSRCNYPKTGEKIDGVVYDGVTPYWCEKGKFCGVKTTHRASLKEIVALLYSFREQAKTLIMPAIPIGSFQNKLYSMYVSYLPKEKIAVDLKMNIDERGSFTELLKTLEHGQFSVNIIKPGATKGDHWHNSKWEFFIVVSGKGIIKERKLGTDEILTFEVSNEKMQAIHMLPGYTHSITNCSQTEDLVALVWANEIFDPNRPDTFYNKV